MIFFMLSVGVGMVIGNMIVMVGVMMDEGNGIMYVVMSLMNFVLMVV